MVESILVIIGLAATAVLTYWTFTADLGPADPAGMTEDEQAEE
jgi:hypothetical protein